MTRPRRLQVLPGFGLSLGMSLLFVAIVLLLPLSGLALNLAELSFADYRAIVSDVQTLAALRVTFWAAAWASLFNALFGLLLAWVLSRYRFPGRIFIDARASGRAELKAYWTTGVNEPTIVTHNDQYGEAGWITWYERVMGDLKMKSERPWERVVDDWIDRKAEKAHTAEESK